jgi:hypothetical protein
MSRAAYEASELVPDLHLTDGGVGAESTEEVVVMKPTSWIAAISSVVLIAMSVQQGSAVEAGGFSNRTFKGSYALGITGTVVSVGPVAGTGLLTSDGNGNLVGTETISYGLGPCLLSLIGTYSVDPDGTGTGSVTVLSAIGGPLCTGGNGSTVTFSLVLSGKGTADKMKLSETSPGFAILAEGDRQ